MVTNQSNTHNSSAFKAITGILSDHSNRGYTRNYRKLQNSINENTPISYDVSLINNVYGTSNHVCKQNRFSEPKTILSLRPLMGA